MDLDRETLGEAEPEDSTPGSDDVEEIVRQDNGPLRLPPRDIRSHSRHFRPPIRRRLNLQERIGRRGDITKTIHVATVEMRRNTGGSDVSSTSNFTIVTSASSTSTSPWSTSGFVEEDESYGEGQAEEEHDVDVEAQGDDEDLLLVPKLEPLDDDDVDMNDVTSSPALEETPPASASSSTLPVTTKRPRGRPRKHPKVNPVLALKVAKGRSKTGCITCRRRKKKCDEGKPGCMNCEKNSVICEGYPEKTTWKNGKERAEEGTTTRKAQAGAEKLIASTVRRRRDSSVLINVKLQPIIPGVETEGDKMFFQHYIYRLSGILTVETEEKHSFKNMLLQLAVKHQGLMHSILALSSKHIDFRSPDGVQFLEDHPDLDIQILEDRSRWHHEMAMAELNAIDIDAVGSDVTIPAMYGQMICLILETLADPNPTGQHRVHLEAYTKLIQKYPPKDQEFLRFIEEFFQYHIVADELISLPQGRACLGAVSDDWNLPTPIVQPESMRLLGVSDGLFVYMSKITNLRNLIRERIKEGHDPPADYHCLFRATEIDAGIRQWTPSWEAGDSRDLSGALYKQMMWIYLWRTIYPPSPKEWRPDARITAAVNDGINILVQFKPDDPNQTLILAPAFVIGCAAFEERQRDQIRKAIATVKAYVLFQNSDTTLKVLEEVWRLMDAKSVESWDWQTIAHRMGMDFLAT